MTVFRIRSYDPESILCNEQSSIEIELFLNKMDLLNIPWYTLSTEKVTV